MMKAFGLSLGMSLISVVGFSKPVTLKALSCLGQWGATIELDASTGLSYTDIQNKKNVFQVSGFVTAKQAGVGLITSSIPLYIPNSKTAVYEIELASEPASGAQGIVDAALWLVVPPVLDLPNMAKSPSYSQSNIVEVLKCNVEMM